MKKIAVILIGLATASSAFAADPPAFTNGQHYAWVTSNQAQSALDYINGAAWFPIKGKNAKSRVVMTNKCQTTKWHDTVVYSTNGFYCFPRIPPTVLDYIGVPVTNRNLFFDVFLPQVKPKQVIVIGDGE